MSSTPLRTTRIEPAVKRLLPPDSSSGAASSITTLAPCSCAASAAQKAALPAPTTITSAVAAIALLRCLRGATMRFRPGGGILHEFFGFAEFAFIEGAALLGRVEHVPPGRERVQRDAKLAQDLLSLGENVVEE